MSLGPAEILVIFVVALLVFGPNRLPEIGRQVGKGVRELRKFQHTLKSDLDGVFGDDQSDSAAPAPTLPPVGAPSAPGDAPGGADSPSAEAPASPVDESAPPSPTDTA